MHSSPFFEVDGLRKLRVKTDIVSQSDGSSSFSQGDSAVLVAVNGPVEARIQKALIDKAYVEVNFRCKTGLPECSDKVTERFLSRTCEEAILTHLHPRTAINITVQEVNNDGCLLACAVNACCMALMNAGIPMGCMIGAITCCLDSNGQLLLDPTAFQLENSSGVLTAVFESNTMHLISIHSEGILTHQQLSDSLKLCESACTQLFSFFRGHTAVEYSFT